MSHTLFWAICIFGALAVGAGELPALAAPDITRAQLKRLLPEPTDLKGFLRNPGGDRVTQNMDLSRPPYNRAGKVSAIERWLNSSDGVYHLEVIVRVYDQAKHAQREMEEHLRGCSAYHKKGTYSGGPAIGDETWFFPGNPSHTFLAFRSGKTFVWLAGGRTWEASRVANRPALAPSTVEEVARLIAVQVAREAAAR